MATERTCAQCGAALPDQGWEGLCPKCLVRVSLQAAAIESGEAEPAGRFGDYELLKEIARGGMGVVYKARQVSLNRTVAVKMILSGQLASTVDVQRFRAEAESAARLQHPNIVAIHEIGQHEGQHYFSMDYVEGQNLAEFVGQKPLPPKQAAKYLETVAEAIHYAHQQGILHRDLKPSNILIDQSDLPRVTDFGLARQMKGDSDLTVSGQVLGSPNFMPPEQAAGKRGQVGPHSDVYALGAILFYMLTARPPFAAESMTETLQLVVNKEPPLPRLLNSGVPRDLETICLKCLEKEVHKRYASAQELKEELGRVLHDEPILARPINRIEKVWRWSRRKPAIAILTAVTVLLLMALAIGSPIAAFRINRARQNAQIEASKSQQVARFLKDMLQGVGPSFALGRDTTMLREILDKTAERLGRDLNNQPAVEAELRSTIGDAYFAIGEYHKAEEMHRQALALYRRLCGPEHASIAICLSHLGADLRFQSYKTTEAEQVLREAVPMAKKFLGNEHPEVAAALDNFALALLDVNKLEEGEKAAREALGIHEKLFGRESAEVAGSLNNLGLIVGSRGHPAEAETAHREALATRQKLFGEEHPEVAKSLANLAQGLADWKVDEAELLANKALAMRKKFLGPEHPQVYISLGILVTVLSKENRLEEAVTVQRDVIALGRKVYPDVTAGLNRLAQLLLRQGKLNEAESAYRDALTVAREYPARHGPQDIARMHKTLGELLFHEGKPGDAIAEFSQATELNLKYFEAYDWRGYVYARMNDYTNAMADLQEALRLNPNYVPALNNLAWVYVTGPKETYSPEKALPLALKAVELSPTNADYLSTLAQAYSRLGREAEAIAILERLVELRPGSARACNDIAWYYVTGPVETRAPERALPLALKAVELGKTNHNELNTLGVVYYRLGEFTNAIATLELGIKTESAGGSAHDFFFLAMAHQRLGDSARADDYFAKALKWLEHQPSLPSESKQELEAFRAEAEAVLGKGKSK
jgi:tetratricopeptide (TPR) repeat protein/tRNA A-37 threonylcarbamoyl transferase component Bud32